MKILTGIFRCTGLAIILICHTGFSDIFSNAELQKRFAAIAAPAHGKVGVAVELLETKETIQLNGAAQFPMQSVYKLPIGMAVLQQIDKGTLRLEQLVQVTTNDFVSKQQHSPIRDSHPAGTELSVSNLLYEMISESDGTACDVLLRLLKGPASVNRYLRELGATNINVVATEKEMGSDELVQYRNWATPEGMIKLLEMVHEGRGLSAPNRKMLLRWMTERSTAPHRIKRLLPPGTPVAHKTGSSGTVSGLTRATNDAGIVTLPDGHHMAITVFVSDSMANETTRDAVITNISRAAWDYFVGRQL